MGNLRLLHTQYIYSIYTQLTLQYTCIFCIDTHSIFHIQPIIDIIISLVLVENTCLTKHPVIILYMTNCQNFIYFIYLRFIFELCKCMYCVYMCVLSLSAYLSKTSILLVSTECLFSILKSRCILLQCGLFQMSNLQEQNKTSFQSCYIFTGPSESVIPLLLTLRKEYQLSGRDVTL